MFDIRMNHPESDKKIQFVWEKFLESAEADCPGFGWWNLPLIDCDEYSPMADELASFESVILIGIGGSSLGTDMLCRAFLSPLQRFARKDSRPVLYFADNVDACTNAAIWERVNPERTALLVISKSGRTLETVANFVYFRTRMIEVLGDCAEEHFYFITGGDSGPLHDYEELHGTYSEVFPANVGGRYSVLSACGMIPALTAGIDVSGILKGAEEMRSALKTESPAERALFCLVNDLLKARKLGKTITVFWAYGDNLRGVGSWFAQLWGESLGKDDIGLTPHVARGSIDQHSQLQLYSCGPKDKYFIFLSSRPSGNGALSISGESSFDSVAYLDGMTQEKVLECERLGVIASLKRHNAPVCELILDGVSGRSFGGLIFFLEALTALTGMAMGIDPFDQPGVEEGKNFALALCGCEKHREYKKEVSLFDVGHKVFSI